jgi:hypothetical protein
MAKLFRVALIVGAAALVVVFDGSAKADELTPAQTQSLVGYMTTACKERNAVPDAPWYVCQCAVSGLLATMSDDERSNRLREYQQAASGQDGPELDLSVLDQPAARQGLAVRCGRTYESIEGYLR